MHRRSFLKTSSAAALAAALPGMIPPTLSRAERESVLNQRLERLPASVPEHKALTQRALDAARSAGATYADVQLRLARQEFWIQLQPTDFVVMAVGVRALVDGYWGFAAFDGAPTLDSMARMGREAVAQAKTGALGKPRTVELAPTPVVADRHWTMPVEADPFSIELGEKVDFQTAIEDYFSRRSVGINLDSMLNFLRDDRTFASSEGSFITQRLYTTGMYAMVGAEGHFATRQGGMRSVDFSGPIGGGWESLLRAPFQDRADQLIEEARLKRQTKPVDIGRYDIVFDANAMAKILDGTIGEATRIDRAMGYQANFEGTSFLNDPAEMIGTFKMGAPRINVTANRSMPAGAATVKWDDEGAEVEEIMLVKDGILNDFQTTRESATWLADVYRKRGQPVRSHGCANTPAATIPVSVGRSNFVLQPAAGSETFESLVASTKKGLAVIGGNISMDHQCLNGAGTPEILREINDGKLGQVIGGANYLIRAPEFWKNVVALGGKTSAYTIGVSGWPKDPLGTVVGGGAHSVSAVPAKVTEIAIIDVMRKGA